MGTLRTIAGMTDADVAELVFVSPHTYRRWKSDRTQDPCAIQLLAIIIGYAAWPGWEKFYFNHYDGKLYCDDLKHGFALSDLWHHHYLAQTAEDVMVENIELKDKIERLEEELHQIFPDPSESDNVVRFPSLESSQQGGESVKMTENARKSRFRDGFARFVRKMSG